LETMKTFDIRKLIEGKKIYYEQEWPKVANNTRYSVGMFFEKVFEVDEDLPLEEIEKWAEKRAMRIAEDNNMVVTQIDVFETPTPKSEESDGR